MSHVISSSSSSSSGLRVFGSSTEGGIRERAISVADVASLVVVVDAGVAHERESFGETRVRHEVRAVIKSGITRDAQAVFVFVEFLHALFLRKFEPGFVGLRRLNSRRRRHAGGSSSSSPVAGSNMLGHRSSCLSLSQVAIIWPIDEKAFQFYSADSVNRRIMIKIGKWGVVTCHRKKIHTPLCVLSRVTRHIYSPRTSLRSANIILASNFSFISRMPEGLASLLRIPIALRAA